MSEKIGQIVKKVHTESNVKIVDLAKKLNTSPQNVHNIFERESIDTQLLYRLGRILKYNFFRHLADHFDSTGDKFIKIEHKVATVDEQDLWKQKFYELSDETRLLLKEHLLLKDQVNSGAEQQMMQVYLTKQDAFQEVVFDVMETRLKETSVEGLRALMGNKIALKLNLI